MTYSAITCATINNTHYIKTINKFYLFFCYIALMRYDQEVILAAKSLWIKGHKASEIKEKLGLNNNRIVYYWAEKNNWGEHQELLTPEQQTAKRFNLLMAIEHKTERDLKELNTLTGILERFANIKHKAQRDNSSQKNNSNRDKKPRKKTIKNDISHLTEADFTRVLNTLFFDYQKKWFENRNQRTRFILKSRQVGGTFYKSFEGFYRAVLTGDNVIFLSASKKQAQIFKAYIILIGKEKFNVELKGGEEIVLSNGAKLQFISTNANTSQGYSGHLYVDEVFWIADFNKLNKVAKPIASQKKYTRTYLSTPSVKEHGAFGLWNGDTFKQNAKTKQQKNIDIDISHEALKDGKLCLDGIWRQIVTIYDAEQSGCNLFDIDELQTEYTASEWRNLFLCEFIDQSESIFNMLDLIACGIDTDKLWRDFNKKSDRPLNNHPVWLGYDPARFGDLSTVVIVAPPQKPGASFRVIEKLRLTGSYPAQAAQIKALLNRFNVEYIGIDRTGPGQGVYDEIKGFFPSAEGIYYTAERKSALVLKVQSLIELRRLEWSNDDDLAVSFIQIKQKVTASDQIIYVADRSAKQGHADYAFAIMNALANEPLSKNKRRSSVTIQH